MANIIPLFKLFMEDWENQARVKLQYCATIRAGLKVAVKHYKCMNDTNAYTIVMCKSYILELHISDIFHDVVLHPLYCMEHITEFWGDNYISKAKEQIKEKVSTLPMEVLMLISMAPGIRCKRTKKILSRQCTGSRSCGPVSASAPKLAKGVQQGQHTPNSQHGKPRRDGGDCSRSGHRVSRARVCRVGCKR